MERNPKREKAKDGAPRPQLAVTQWQRARSLVREITTTPTPLLKSSSSAFTSARLIWASFTPMCSLYSASQPPFVFASALMRRKEKQEGARGAGGKGSGGEEEENLAGRLAVALHINMGWKHKDCLFDFPILLPRGEWKNMHETAIRHSPALPPSGQPSTVRK